MYLLVKAIFVAVEGGPETLTSWDLVKKQQGLPVGAFFTSTIQKRYGTAPDLIN
jgi:hypothetical protein